MERSSWRFWVTWPSRSFSAEASTFNDNGSNLFLFKFRRSVKKSVLWWYFPDKASSLTCLSCCCIFFICSNSFSLLMFGNLYSWLFLIVSRICFSILCISWMFLITLSFDGIFSNKASSLTLSTSWISLNAPLSSFFVLSKMFMMSPWVSFPMPTGFSQTPPWQYSGKRDGVIGNDSGLSKLCDNELKGDLSTPSQPPVPSGIKGLFGGSE